MKVYRLEIDPYNYTDNYGPHQLGYYATKELAEQDGILYWGKVAEETKNYFDGPPYVVEVNIATESQAEYFIIN